MERDLNTALYKLLAKGLVPSRFPPTVQPSAPPALSGNLAAMALEHYNKAKAHLRQGDWAAYGKELKELEKILKQLAKRNKKDFGK